MARLLTGTLAREHILTTLLDRVGRHREVNEKAFEAGYEYDASARSQTGGRS